jgi:hypothetical protein
MRLPPIVGDAIVLLVAAPVIWFALVTAYGFLGG